ncbi:MAG: acetyl-CoA acetyltransferase [Chloroflexaceae bacterium]|nr:acetyl-CoA acetyltransferase [Chloroflexaceae bacterium]
MNNVYIIGAGATPVGEHYSRSLQDLALEGLRSALADTQADISPRRIGALYVANAYGESLAGQGQLGAAIASAAGLEGIPALRVEAAGASGGVALRQAMLSVASGAFDLVAVVGVEKVTDKLEAAIEAAQMLATDSDFEAEQGITPAGQWALLMRRYMHEYGYEADAFAPFPVNAHANASHNKGALYRFAINADKYRKATHVASPLNMLDCSTLADGAAVLLLASEGLAREVGQRRVRLAGSALATDTLALHSRRDPLWLGAAQQSAGAALKQAGLKHADIHVLELSDPHGIAAALALEASGFVERGSAPRHAADGGISLAGATPLATGGGYKARGDVGGASGVYQAVELVRQLRGEAGQAQVQGARVGFAQCMGGVGVTVVSHLLMSE